MLLENKLLNMNNITEIENGVYSGFPSYNKTDYIEKLKLKVLEIYSDIHSLNQLIISTEFPISENSSYYFNDPWENHGLIEYDKELVEKRHKEMFSMACAIVKKNN